MKAMILAAGLGTRLLPLTKNRPKALIEIDGIPLLELIINRIKKFGINEIIINVHHFADQVAVFLKQKNNFGISIILSDESDLLLDTGGGLKKAGWFFNDKKPFLLHNVDVLTNLDITSFYQSHIKSGALVSIAIKERPTSRSFLFNSDYVLSGWRNHLTGEEKIVYGTANNLTPVANSCAYIINPEIFDYITETGVFSLTDVLIRLAKNHKIIGYRHDESFWVDLGRKENIDEAGKILNEYLK